MADSLSVYDRRVFWYYAIASYQNFFQHQKIQSIQLGQELPEPEAFPEDPQDVEELLHHVHRLAETFAKTTNKNQSFQLKRVN